MIIIYLMISRKSKWWKIVIQIAQGKEYSQWLFNSLSKGYVSKENQWYREDRNL
jgi:hypothetical protein